MLRGGFPRVRGVPQAKGLDRLGCESTLLQVRQGGRSLGGLQQVVAIKIHRRFEERTQAIEGFVLSPAFGGDWLQSHPGALRQVAQGFRKIPALFLHHEAEDVTALVALTEAAPGAGFREDGESGRTRVGMKWAKAGIALSGTSQFDRFGDEIDDVDPGFDLVNG